MRMRWPELSFLPRQLVIWCALLALLTSTMQVAHGQNVLLRDDFNNRFDSTTELNPSKWTVFGQDLAYARTQFGNKPAIASDADGTSFARLKLSTYNYNAHPLYTLKGTEITSPLFARENGKEFEARVRCRNLSPGIVGAFWAFGEQGQWGTSGYKKDETDIEFLSNWSRSTLLLTTWNDWNPQAGYAFNDGVHHSDRVAAVNGLNWDSWNTYKIRWLPDHTEWYVNGVLIHSSLASQPDDPMGVRFNIWAPDPSWSDAYSAALAPTTEPTANADYFLDVDWVEVRGIGPAPGTGTGLSATYFDNMDLTGPSVTRIDPRVDFDWGSGSPDAAIANDTFSATWTGQVEAQYTQTYTFSTLSDDGVRLWVDGRLLIDHWTDQGATEWSGTIALVAGHKYAIKLAYYDNGLDAKVQLRWSSPSTPQTIIPQSQLYPSSPVTPTPTATTVPTPTAVPTATPVPTTTAAPLPIISVNSPSRLEGNGGIAAPSQLLFTLSLSKASTQTVTVIAQSAYASPLPATANSDYLPLAKTRVVFAPGQIRQTVAINISGDTTYEDNERVNLVLSAPTAATLGVSTGQGTILNDDPLPSFSINDVTILEGNLGYAKATFTISLSQPSGKTATVTYSTYSSGAGVALGGTTSTVGADYLAISPTTLTFAPGQVSKLVTVYIKGDTTIEANEAFLVRLASPINARLTRTAATGTIQNDDNAP